jgi:hypothetical protein
MFTTKHTYLIVDLAGGLEAKKHCIIVAKFYLLRNIAGDLAGERKKCYCRKLT